MARRTRRRIKKKNRRQRPPFERSLSTRVKESSIGGKKLPPRENLRGSEAVATDREEGRGMGLPQGEVILTLSLPIGRTGSFLGRDPNAQRTVRMVPSRTLEPVGSRTDRDFPRGFRWGNLDAICAWQASIGCHPSSCKPRRTIETSGLSWKRDGRRVPWLFETRMRSEIHLPCRDDSVESPSIHEVFRSKRTFHETNTTS